MTDSNYNDNFETIMDNEGINKVFDDTLVDVSFSSMTDAYSRGSFVSPFRPSETLAFEKHLQSIDHLLPAPNIDGDMEPM